MFRDVEKASNASQFCSMKSTISCICVYEFGLLWLYLINPYVEFSMVTELNRSPMVQYST
jgi:hypothetical protein